eukprot:1864453-Alexandrium_andersonii.AAC.1
MSDVSDDAVGDWGSVDASGSGQSRGTADFHFDDLVAMQAAVSASPSNPGPVSISCFFKAPPHPPPLLAG